MFKGQGKNVGGFIQLRMSYEPHIMCERDQYNKDTKTKAEYFMIAERTR